MPVETSRPCENTMPFHRRGDCSTDSKFHKIFAVLVFVSYFNERVYGEIFCTVQIFRFRAFFRHFRCTFGARRYSGGKSKRFFSCSKHCSQWFRFPLPSVCQKNSRLSHHSHFFRPSRWHRAEIDSSAQPPKTALNN